MKKISTSGNINHVSMRNYYNFMRNSFESVIRGDARNMSRSEINACYEWRIANILIKNTLKAESFFSYAEWESFVNSCGRRVGLSGTDIRKINERIEALCSDIVAEANNMWRSDEERRRHKEAVERLNKFLSVDMYSTGDMRGPTPRSA